MKKLLLALLILLGGMQSSFAMKMCPDGTWIAGGNCRLTPSGTWIGDGNSGNNQHTNQHFQSDDWGYDYEKAGQGLRNILRWLNENSTSNTNKQPKSYGGNNTQVYVPPNAYETYYNGKSGFACNVGYKKSGNSCIKQTSSSNYAIPDNAYRTKGTWKCLSGYYSYGFSCNKIPANGYASGSSFECGTGYKKSGNSCLVKAPNNAYVYGDSWKCNSGFYKNNDYCYKLPSNAIAERFIDGFYCQTGYKRSGNSCIKKVVVPEFGYASGDSFKCLNGYRKSGSQCVIEKSLPANAIAYGDDFKCKYGFYKEYGTSCKKIPTDNAYAYGLTWLCNFGYIKVDNQCIKKEERPENSYPISNGGWKCKVGFEKIENKCIEETTQLVETESKEFIVEKPINEVEKQAEFLERIAQAKSLLDSGIISEEEFSDITKRIIEKSQESSTQLKDEEDAYKQLLVEEIELEKKQLTDDQINTLKSAYVNNIAAEVKSYWRYQGSEDDWTCEVYVIQDRDGTVVAADVRNCNVGDSSRAKSFKDSIERAVYKASPLPIAPDEAVFDKEFIMTFSVN